MKKWPRRLTNRLCFSSLSALFFWRWVCCSISVFNPWTYRAFHKIKERERVATVKCILLISYTNISHGLVGNTNEIQNQISTPVLPTCLNPTSYNYFSRNSHTYHSPHSHRTTRIHINRNRIPNRRHSPQTLHAHLRESKRMQWINRSD